MYLGSTVSILGELTKRTDSIIAIILVIVILGAFLVGIPFYKRFSDNKMARLKIRSDEEQSRADREMMREKNSNDAMSSLASALTELRVVLGSINKNCSDCKDEQVGLYKDMIFKQDETLSVVKSTHRIVDERLDRRTRVKPVEIDRRKEE